MKNASLVDRGRNKFFPDPLADWDNDDLLLTDRARMTVEAAYPAAFRILDWPELREEFAIHDRQAAAEKNKINRHGMWGAVLTTFGVSIVTIAPLLPPGWAQRLAVIPGCALVVIGALIGLSHLFFNDARNKWLIHRIWAERLRQFYFQFIINNLHDITTAMAEDAALASYRSTRNAILRAFMDMMQAKLSSDTKRRAIQRIAADHQDTQTWTQFSWNEASTLAGFDETASNTQLFECLHYRRIEIQSIYATRNLVVGANGPRGMSLVAGKLADFLTVVFVISLFFAGYSIASSDSNGSRLPDILIALSGVAAACGLFLRLLDQGMGYSLDAERYELYLGQMELVKQRFEDARSNMGAKVDALRQLEVYAYREMRQFLNIHLRSRFI